MRNTHWLSALLFPAMAGMIIGCSASEEPAEPAHTLKPKAMDWSLVAKTQPATRWYWLFDGETLNSWTLHSGDAEWLAEEGALTAVATGTPSHIATIAEYDNFAMTVDFFAEEGHAAGVIIRGQSATDKETPINPVTGYEINAAGTIRDLVAHQPASVTSGRWNTLEITADGDHITVRLNQQITADVHDSTHATGIIALQAAGTGRVKYRNIKFRDL